MKINEDSILAFWQWFVKSESIIKECIENDASEHRDYVVDQLNEYILTLGMLTWDIGLNDYDNWFFMLSPNGNADMLNVSVKIMDFAPDHMPWLFYSSRPEKNWNRQFTVYDQYMDEIEIDASLWEYIIFDDDDDPNKFELVLEAKNIAQLVSEDATAAAEHFVTHEIGEAARIVHFSKITVVDSVDSEDESLKEPVSVLKEHLGEIT